MAYSNFSRKQAGVLFKNFKEGKLKMTDETVKMMYAQADAYINHDVVLDDIEAKLRNAVDAVFQNDLAKAQEEIDLAAKVYNAHFGVVA